MASFMTLLAVQPFVSFAHNTKSKPPVPKVIARANKLDKTNFGIVCGSVYFLFSLYVRLAVPFSVRIITRCLGYDHN